MTGWIASAQATSPALLLGSMVLCGLAVCVALYVWRWSRRGY